MVISRINRLFELNYFYQYALSKKSSNRKNDLCFHQPSENLKRTIHLIALLKVLVKSFFACYSNVVNWLNKQNNFHRIWKNSIDVKSDEWDWHEWCTRVAFTRSRLHNQQKTTFYLMRMKNESKTKITIFITEIQTIRISR